MTLGIATGGRLNAGASLDHDQDLIAETGAQAVRWYPQWNNVERVLGSGNYDWRETDAIMGGFASRGLKVCVGISARGDGRIFDADKIEAIGPYAAAVAERVLPFGNVIAFEGPNESNSSKADPNPSGARYVACQRALYTAIKAVDASVPVGHGGIVGSSKPLIAIYAAGGKPYFDMVMWHPYSFPLSPTESLKQEERGFHSMYEARKVMVANGDTAKKIWITEFASPTGPPGGPRVRTEEQQASDLRDAVTTFRKRPWSGPFFHFSGWDSRDTGDKRTGDYMGLYKASDEPKLSFAVFQELAAEEAA